MVTVILKTPKNLESVVASRVEELTGCRAEPRPGGYSGIVFLTDCPKAPDEVAQIVLSEVPEAEKVLPVYAECEADPEAIAESALKVAKTRIVPGEPFAVRTTRRGVHGFRSIDVNVAVGARIKEELGNPVDLTNPSKVVWVEIFGDRAYISVTEEQVWRKPKSDVAVRMARKVVAVQLPFLGDLQGVYRMGVRIGRAAQAFEIRELIIALKEPADALELAEFLRGVLEGVDARFGVQKRTYSRRVSRVKVSVYELYQLARAIRGEPVIITSAKGEPITREVCERIIRLFEEHSRVYVFIGAREGIPTGLFRWADEVINLAPGITFATEHGIPTALTAVIMCWELLRGAEDGGEAGASDEAIH